MEYNKKKCTKYKLDGLKIKELIIKNNKFTKIIKQYLFVYKKILIYYKSKVTKLAQILINLKYHK